MPDFEFIGPAGVYFHFRIKVFGRYGFVYVDRDNDGSGTLERSRKDSYDWFKKVIESNGEDLD